MSDAVKGRIKLKAAGGIRSLETIQQMMDLGVTRFGVNYKTAVELVQQAGL